MPESEAIKNFKKSIALSEELIKLNGSFSNPPKATERSVVQGLRGGAAVLMVASFEFFLRALFKEHLSSLVSIPVSVDFNKLPDKMKIGSVYNTLERATKGPLYHKSKKIDRIPDIELACKIIVANNINPEAFSDTGSNPNSLNVKSMFLDVGIDNIFDKIKTRFERDWGQHVTMTFISDKLNEIVNRRHLIAHTADALNVTRTDLRTSIKFLKILAKQLDKELADHVKHLRRVAAI